MRIKSRWWGLRIVFSGSFGIRGEEISFHIKAQGYVLIRCLRKILYCEDITLALPL
jgi:hypothetical protein